MPQVTVRGVPDWVPYLSLLGNGDWSSGDDGWTAELGRVEAADLSARLRNIGLGGSPLEVEVRPALKRKLVREARTADARRRRQTTPGFTRPGCRLDPEGKMSLTAESLALALGTRAAGRAVVDACAGAGGNAIGFARAGCSVTCIEPHAGRIRDAAHNARVYGVADRIEFLHGSALDLLPTMSGDLLFLDPPWGEDWNRTRSDLTGVPLLAPALRAAAGRFGSRWLKLPPSFDVSLLPEFAPTAVFGQAEGDRQRVKYLILRDDA